MQANEVADAAANFLSKLQMIDQRLNVQVGEVVPDAGRFCEIFRTDHRNKPGAYWFFLANKPVFYIGKCDANVWVRISAHAMAPVWEGNGPANYKDGVGDGWVFPTSKYIAKASSEAMRSEIRQGNFHVGWAALGPEWGYCAALLEVYLQTLFATLNHGALPELCRKIG